MNPSLPPFLTNVHTHIHIYIWMVFEEHVVVEEGRQAGGAKLAPWSFVFLE